MWRYQCKKKAESHRPAVVPLLAASLLTLMLIKISRRQRLRSWFENNFLPNSKEM